MSQNGMLGLYGLRYEKMLYTKETFVRLLYEPIMVVRYGCLSNRMFSLHQTIILDFVSYNCIETLINRNFINSMPSYCDLHVDRVKRIWYLSPMRAAKVQASLRIRAVSPEPPLLAHTSIESRFLASLNGWACAVKTCHDGMLEDTNSLDGAHVKFVVTVSC